MTAHSRAGGVILSRLDCGCVIYGDGGREWCPTCLAGGPRPAAPADTVPLAEGAAQHIRNAQALAWVWRDITTALVNVAGERYYRDADYPVPVAQLAGLRDALDAISHRLDAARAAIAEGRHV